MLYGERGKKFQGDAYEVGNFPRDQIKHGFNIAVNARAKRAAVCALAEKAGIGRADAAQLLGAIEKRHKPIGEAFCSDAGVRLMRIDSELILGALRALNDEGIPALPVHDALIAPAHCIDRAVEKMAEVFEKMVGRVSKPLPDKDKRGKGSTNGRVGELLPDPLLFRGVGLTSPFGPFHLSSTFTATSSGWKN
jgi:hypothetical protein